MNGVQPRPKGFALVVGFLATSNCEFDLGPSVFKVQRERDQRQTALFHGGYKSVKFFAVYQQFSITARRVIGPCCFRVLRNMNPAEPEFTILNHRKTIYQ